MRSVLGQKGTRNEIAFVASILIGAAFFCLTLAALAQTNNPAERIFYNAKVFTAESQHPYAEAVAIRGDKIVAVGSRAAVTKAVGGGAQSIDLHGKSLLPGLIDSHVHPILGGFILSSPDAGDDKVRSVADLAAIAAEAMKSGRGMQGDILMISRIPLTIWSKTNELNAVFNAGAFEKLPIFLWGTDGHTG